ncbi:MAG: hypothetical protein CR986_06970 [Ignavibacteriae bacterium]|nr:MAG: hypothetical protein CR986_06970 [Ignavibacteriota bacterium]
MDISTFISYCNTYFKNASITFDKSHVVKEVNKAMNKLRRLGHKYTFLRSKLRAELNSEKYFLTETLPRLGERYRLVKIF